MPRGIRSRGQESSPALSGPGAAEYGARWESERIIDSHPRVAIGYYNPLVPAVNLDNNDFGRNDRPLPVNAGTPSDLRAMESPSAGNRAPLSSQDLQEAIFLFLPPPTRRRRRAIRVTR